MTDAEFTVILEAVVAKFGATALRTKTDPSHPDYKPGMRESVIMMHEGKTRESKAPHPPDGVPLVVASLVTGTSLIQPEIRLTVSQSLAFQAEAKACEHRSRDAGCGCSGYRCAAGRGRGGIVNDWDCLRCLRYTDESGTFTTKGLPTVAASQPPTRSAAPTADASPPS